MRHRALFSLLIAWVALGCAQFDTTRATIWRGTLGEEIVRVFCERMASEADPADVDGLRYDAVCRGERPPPDDAPARLRVLMANRERLAGALDRVLPEAMHDDLGAFLGAILPLYDPPRERLPQDTRILAALLEAVADDREALEALARIGTREGYRPLRLSLGFLRPLLAYPELDTLARRTLRALSDVEGDPSDGQAAQAWAELRRALALELATLQPAEPADDVTTLRLVRDLLFTQDAAFSAGGPPRWALVRDERGLGLPAGGLVVPPFADVDGDGLADVDPRSGRFLDASGAFAVIPPPFRIRFESGVPRDAGGRALRSDATRIWEYIDLDRTLLAAIVRESASVFDPAQPTLMRIARGLPAILGPEIERTRRYGAATLHHPGPDTSRGSLFDVAYALGEILHRDSTDRALALAEILLRDHPRPTASLVASIEHMIERADAHPEAQLERPNVLWDDLIALATSYAREPGLLEAMLRAFADPRSAQLGRIYGEMMRHRDRIDYDPANPNASPIGLPLDERADRSRPDVRGNESLFQRSIALIDALNGVRVCNREGARLDVTVRIGPLSVPLRYPFFGTAGECELIRIDNVAEAYALAILGRYELEIQDGLLAALIDVADALRINVDDALEASSGIDGLTRRPTPRALNRLVFWGLDHRPGMTCSRATPEGCNSTFAGQLFDRVRDRHGNDVIDTFGGTIFAWEQPGFYEGMTPLLEVLHDDRWRHDAAGRYRFGQLIATLHVHWASREHWLTQHADPARPNFSYQDDARSYEELIADGFVDGRLLERLQALGAVLDGIEIDPGRDGLRTLAEAAIDLLDPARSPDLRTRDGRTDIPWNDGTRRFQPTPLLLVLEAMRNLDRDLDAQPERAEAWRTGRGYLAQQLLSTQPSGEEAQFANPRARPILLALIRFLRERLAAHRASGDLVEWSRGLVDDLQDALSSPLAAGIVRLLDRVQDDPEARDALGGLLDFLVDETSPHDAFAATLHAAADLLMALEDDENLIPIARGLSRALAPNALEVVASGGELDVDASIAGDAPGLLRELAELDDRSTLRTILANLVELDDEPDAATPLEEILEVLSEINRASPGAGGAYTADDYATAMREVRGFLTDERRGLERLYDVIQEREIR